MDDSAIIEIIELTKIYGMGEVQVKALNEVNLTIHKGEFVSIMGPSGSGKSTLMNVLGCLDRPTSGKYFLAGEDVSDMDKTELAIIRNQRIGFIFQSFHLIPRLSALENVELPLLLAGAPVATRRERAREVLDSVGLSSRIDHRPDQLSGGERQRVAIGRAIVMKPGVLLADEPTGNLDSKTGKEIMAMLDELHDGGHTIILVTHEDDIARHAQRVIHLKDGRIEIDVRQPLYREEKAKQFSVVPD